MKNLLIAMIVMTTTFAMAQGTSGRYAWRATSTLERGETGMQDWLERAPRKRS
jgi:hypothetical protein